MGNSTQLVPSQHSRSLSPPQGLNSNPQAVFDGLDDIDGQDDILGFKDGSVDIDGLDDIVGDPDGNAVGDADGKSEGEALGEADGRGVSDPKVGFKVGDWLGSKVGD